MFKAKFSTTLFLIVRSFTFYLLLAVFSSLILSAGSSAQNLNSAVTLHFQDIPDSLFPYGLVYELASRNLEFQNKEQELFLSAGFLEIKNPSEIDESWSEFLIGFYVNSRDKPLKIKFPLGNIYFHGSLKPRANGYYAGAIQGLVFEKKVFFASLEFMFEKFILSPSKIKIFYGGNLEMLNPPNNIDNFKFRIGPKGEFVIPLKNKINLKLSSSLFYELSGTKNSFLVKFNLNLGGKGSFIF